MRLALYNWNALVAKEFAQKVVGIEFIYPNIIFEFDPDKYPELLFPDPIDKFEVNALQFVTQLREGLISDMAEYMDFDIGVKFKAFMKEML